MTTSVQTIENMIENFSVAVSKAIEAITEKISEERDIMRGIQSDRNDEVAALSLTILQTQVFGENAENTVEESYAALHLADDLLEIATEHATNAHISGLICNCYQNLRKLKPSV